MYRVFLADDEPFIIEGLYDVVDWAALQLEIVGHAANGRDALEALRETPADIVITDISMPVMNGLQLIRGVRELRPETKCIVLSGYNEFDFVKEGLTLGIENYLLKPINLEELRETLANAVEKLEAGKESERPRGVPDRFEISILQENVLYRWLTERITQAEFAERAELIGLDVGKPFMTAAIVRIGSSESFGDASEPFESAYAAVKRFFAADPDAVPFANPDGDIAVVFLFDEPERGKARALDALRGLRETLGSFGSARITVGSVERTEGRPGNSYRRALKAQEYFLLRDPAQVLDYDALNAERRGSDALQDFEWHAFAQLVLAKDRERLLRSIDETFETYRRAAGATPELLQGLAIEMIVRLKLELREMKRVDHPGLFRDELEQVLQATSKDRLASLVKTAAEGAIDALNRDVKSPVVQQIINRIHAAYAEPLSLKSFGIEYNIHPNYLGQLFQKETRETFTDYMNKYRIEKAKQLLKETNDKVHEIARRVGYWETGYFYKQFKKYVGVSPSEFKELL